MGARLCAWSYAALCVVVPLWYALWFPHSTALWTSGGLLLAGAVQFLRRSPGGYTWAGMVALLVFIHGLTEAMVHPEQLAPALSSAGLALVYFIGLWLQIQIWKAARRKQAATGGG